MADDLGKEEKIKNQKDDSNNSKTEEERISNLSQSSEINDVTVIEYDKDENINLDFIFKVIVIGNASVGKSSLIDRGTKNRFFEDYHATIGFDYSPFIIKYENKVIKLQIWDTCGQEIYQSLITNFYRNSSLAIMVYSINDRKSFDALDNWLKELKKESNPDSKIILIGNKVDLESERLISYEEAEKYAQDFNFISFIETSAKTGFNAKKVFINAAKILYEEYIKYNKSVISENENIIKSLGNSKLTRGNKKEKSRNCC